jgi:hypothetical protein
MIGKYSRFKFNILYQAGKFISFYKNYLLVFFIVFLIGFITGIMTCSHYSNIITYENLINKYLIKFLTKEHKFTTFFLILSAYFIIISLVAILFTKNIFMIVIDFVVLLLTSYIFGFDLCIIILSFGLAGVIFGVVVLGLMGFLIFTFLQLILSVAMKRCIVAKKSCDGLKSSHYAKVYCLLIALSLFCLYIMCMLFSIIHIFIIVD